MNEQVTQKPQLLVVDDSKVIRHAAKNMLAADYDVLLAEDGQIAWQMLQKENAILAVFTDLSMPNLDGMGLLNHIRHSNIEHIVALPVIIMTGHDDSSSIKQEVIAAGATDFVSKPFDSIDLTSRAKAYVRLSQNVVELEKKTAYDKLTGLYNASSLQMQGSKATSLASRHRNPLATVVFEIADFQKNILSHDKRVAQHIIKVVGQRLQQGLREEDIAARTGIAKYTLLLPMTNQQNAEILISRICQGMSKLVFDTGKERIQIKLVAGYTAPDLDELTVFEEILAQAESALQQAVNSLSKQVVCYDKHQDIKTSTEIITEQDMRQAFSLILSGNFHQIPPQHLVAVQARLSPFLQHANKQMADRPVVATEKQDNTIDHRFS